MKMAFDHIVVIKFHYLVFIFLWLHQAALLMVMSSSYGISKPGCVNKCGDVRIPYPFGIGDKNCFFDEYFSITCNETFPPKAFIGELELLDINIHGQLRGTVPIVSNCYDNYGKQTSIFDEAFLGKFTFSNTRNKLVGIGCDTLAVIKGNNNYTTGCISYCDSFDQVINGSCNGIGCCQSPIPTGLTAYLLEIRSFKNNPNRFMNPCSYAFLAEESWFNFSSSDLQRNQNRSKVPVVIDWAVGNETCEEAKKNITGTYSCGVNSYCYNPSNRNGYRCYCREGYEGNPYLINGCQDIDECKKPTLNGCSHICTNTLGAYECSCPDGYLGDGHKIAFGCKRNKRRLTTVVLGMGAGIMVVLLLALSFWLYRRLEERKQIQLKQHYFKKNGGLLLKQKISSHDDDMEKDKIFVIQELEKATDNFNQSRIIGKGGFGTVYKGMLSDGRIVAIKKSKLIDESQVDQFINEVAILSQIIHRHAVKLLGCCLETHVPLLVYEYVSNGTLFQHLHSEGYVSSISWNDRLRIAAEIARALAYMHSEASMPIFHRDIKSSNILLDETYRAKVSDFGLSRSVPVDKTHLTTLVQGTFGYLDPEYFQSCQFTDKSDVYSFGVVLVELLTGERAISVGKTEDQKSLAMHFISALRNDRLFEILEARVVAEGDRDELMIVAKITKSCLKLNGKKRPLMKEVAASLERLRKFQEEPWVEPNMLQEDDFLVGEASSRCTTILEVDDYDDSNSVLMST